MVILGPKSSLTQASIKGERERSSFDLITNLKMHLLSVRGVRSYEIHGGKSSWIELQSVTVTLFPCPEGVTLTN